MLTHSVSRLSRLERRTVEQSSPGTVSTLLVGIFRAHEVEPGYWNLSAA